MGPQKTTTFLVTFRVSFPSKPQACEWTPFWRINIVGRQISGTDSTLDEPLEITVIYCRDHVIPRQFSDQHATAVTPQINSNIGLIFDSLRDVDAFSFKIAWFPTPSLFDATSKERPAISSYSLYTLSKSTFSGLQSCRRLYRSRSSFVQPLLPSKIAKSREFWQNLTL